VKRGRCNLEKKTNQKIIPYYVRINRLIRDIPSTSIMAGNKISNLRQVLQKEMQKRNLECRCIRCREARTRKIDIRETKLFVETYNAASGQEYFLSYVRGEALQ